MTAKGARKYPDDVPLVVTPLTTAGHQPWHDRARELRDDGLSIREISRNIGKGFGSIQRLFNPASKRKAKVRQSVAAKERRATDQEYRESSRSYVRRYMQQRNAPNGT